MQESEIVNKLDVIFKNVFADESIQISPDLTADDVEGWDSLSHVDMIVSVEEEFQIRLTTREVASLKNVGNLIQIIQNKKTV
ncbi:MAG: acyl carrier protein [Sphingobacteriales bacterium]|nr:MAG: acyl carrier protein [Sphingobacteriales bacterium]